ncbi:MAG: single-stranded DNA-binding protein [Bacteroidales bacterium]|nr:single-stranded DNA-binding protein [Bacteroidales bacterium]
MDGVNRVILLGNLGNDPEVKTFDDGNKIVRFPIATNETYKNRNGEKVSNTEWHTIIVRRQGLAEVVEKYLKKGNQVYLEGKLKTRKWQDKDGNNRYSTEVHMDNMTMMGGGTKSDEQPQQTESAPKNVEEPPIGDQEGDDLPF